MNNPEHAPLLEPDFGLEAFDFNAAFQGAMQDVITDEEIALEEKIRRMEVIVTEGTSDTYREFIDFRSMAAQMQMMCNHVHGLEESLNGNDVLSNFMNDNITTDERGHTKHDQDDDDEIDPKTGKKKRRRWFY